MTPLDAVALFLLILAGILAAIVEDKVKEHAEQNGDMDQAQQEGRQ